MENLQPGGGSGSSDVAGESPDSRFQLNIITLDSRKFSFHVDKNILVSAFKEKIASQVSVPVGQQRLIFRGKVLKDEDLLSEYNVEHGDTLHLVERQPPSPPGFHTREATPVNIIGGHDSHAGGSHNHIGQTDHGAVLGSGIPGLYQAMLTGAVLDAVGIGNLVGNMQPGVQSASNPMQNSVRTATSPLFGASSSSAVGQHVFQSLPSFSTMGDANDVADGMPQDLGSSSLGVLLAGVSRQTGAGPFDILRHILLQVTQSPDARNYLNQMDNRDIGCIVSEILRDMPSAFHPNPPREQVFPESRDMNGYPQVDIRDAVRRVGIISPEEILFNLVHVAVRPSNIADANLVYGICSQTEHAMEFMKMVLSELSRRMGERGRLYGD